MNLACRILNFHANDDDEEERDFACLPSFAFHRSSDDDKDESLIFHSRISLFLAPKPATPINRTESNQKQSVSLSLYSFR